MIFKVSAVLLAAGLSTRMGVDKLLLKHKGKTFLQHSIDLMQELPVFERIVVTTDVRLKHIALPLTTKLCINPHPEQGQSTSIKAGVEAAAGTHYLFLNADQPLLTLEDLIPILNAANMNPEKIVFPLIDSKPNSPTLFPSSFKDKLINLRGDIGGKVIRDAHRELWHTVQPENPENFTDIDNVEDYTKLKGQEP